MYPKFRWRRILAPAPSACPPGRPSAFCVHDACPGNVETPTDWLQTHGPLPTMSPAATGSKDVLAKALGVTHLSVPAWRPPHIGAQMCSGTIYTLPRLSSSKMLLPVTTT